MDKLKLSKVVSALPATLEKNTIYFVKSGSLFDIYITNNLGTVIPYSLNKTIVNVNLSDYNNDVPFLTEQQIINDIVKYDMRSADHYYFVCDVTGDDLNDGSLHTPFKTITKALTVGKTIKTDSEVVLISVESKNTDSYYDESILLDDNFLLISKVGASVRDLTIRPRTQTSWGDYTLIKNIKFDNAHFVAYTTEGLHNQTIPHSHIFEDTSATTSTVEGLIAFGLKGITVYDKITFKNCMNGLLNNSTFKDVDIMHDVNYAYPSSPNVLLEQDVRIKGTLKMYIDGTSSQVPNVISTASNIYNVELYNGSIFNYTGSSFTNSILVDSSTLITHGGNINTLTTQGTTPKIEGSGSSIFNYNIGSGTIKNAWFPIKILRGRVSWLSTQDSNGEVTYKTYIGGSIMKDGFDKVSRVSKGYFKLEKDTLHSFSDQFYGGDVTINALGGSYSTRVDKWNDQNIWIEVIEAKRRVNTSGVDDWIYFEWTF